MIRFEGVIRQWSSEQIGLSRREFYFIGFEYPFEDDSMTQ